MEKGSPVQSISDIRPDGTLVCGTESEDVIISKIINNPTEPPIITPVRLWLYEGSVGEASSLDTSYSMGVKINIPGKWDENITALCLWCGKRFIVNQAVLDIINDIQRTAVEKAILSTEHLTVDQLIGSRRHLPHQDEDEYFVGLKSDATWLPDSAYKDPRLLSRCPVCEKPLRLNLFIVDDR